MENNNPKEAGHVPVRTCVGCGKKLPKRQLTRLVLEREGQLAIDEPQIAPGRGAYLCGAGCLKAAAKRRAIQRAFRGKLESLGVLDLEAALQRTPRGS